ncbi:hypothetical protein PRIPAC_72058 [Pristionchus pacificus]|uniref:Uncharacterized protein n=1 Tax=Pristionchus pacificus TaxID=54126 RepID=A0A2A6C813_PRIPA|nr:hypothetical protein PRIPAC_72058 [Pristionchus pacificus]|eukprot:PDM74299.1 hypothetical protein PRIPAC_41655 [Pristionchus pacificus]
MNRSAQYRAWGRPHEEEARNILFRSAFSFAPRRYSEATKAFVKAKFDEYAKRGAKLKADRKRILASFDKNPGQY